VYVIVEALDESSRVHGIQLLLVPLNTSTDQPPAQRQRTGEASSSSNPPVELVAVAIPQEQPYPFNLMKTGANFYQLHNHLFHRADEDTLRETAPQWIYILSLGIQKPPSPATKYYDTFAGWRALTWVDRELTLIGCGGVQIAPNDLSVILHLASVNKLLVLQVNEDKLWLPFWSLGNDELTGSTLTGTFSASGISESRRQFAYALLSFISNRMTNPAFFRQINTIAAAGWSVIKATGGSAGLDDVTAALTGAPDQTFNNLRLARNQVEPTGTLAGMVAILSVSVVAQMNLQRRWEEFLTQREVISSTQSLTLLADQLQLNLPVTDSAVKGLCYESGDKWEPIESSTLVDESLVPTGTRAASGQQVVDFMRNPPSHLYVSLNPTTVLFRRRGGSGGRAAARLDRAGTVGDLAMPVLPGRIFRTLMAPVRSAVPAQAVNPPTATAAPGVFRL